MATRKSAPRLLTWEQVRKAYPDEWVVLGDLDLDSGPRILCGVVLGHAKTRREAHETTQEATLGKLSCTRWTGKRDPEYDIRSKAGTIRIRRAR
ncbi:MAG: hypothetical protein EXR72_21095 [Myxococcales bacterium]|nr:hypothetical protein [Myxococcales bacterium]